PRFEMVLAEAKRVRDRFDAELNLIYVGDKDEPTERRFAEALGAMGLPAESSIHYQTGSPAEAIMKAASANHVELIVAGALEKEVVLRPFLGNVARRLVREATCSVMLFTNPDREPKPLQRIVFYVANYNEHTRRALCRTARLAEREGAENLYVIRVYTTFDAARATLRETQPDNPAYAAARTLEEEEDALEQFIESACETSVPVEPRCISGNTGFVASDFVQAVEADLLVVSVEPTATPEPDELPAHIAWVTDVIPCNLWVIR
ncbi:MAG TPA: universal stress protein, partial [Chthoniobacterales bacterium]|nr:universal stress protein [Chthoniobacterales bacterium]